MSNLSPEQQYQTIPELLDFAINQRIKDYFFCLPGLVVSFDATTRRITAKVALRQILTDSKVEYALLHDVPVLYPSSVNHVIYFPLTTDDAVLLHFSQRGIETFKKTFALSDPSTTSLLSFTDAVASPGFGAINQPIADEDALTLQTADGQTHVTIKQGVISLTATTINLNGSVNIQNTPLPASHTHGGVSSGTDNTLPPNP